uniref:Uncharacterized protein n=1 Tax=Globodera rostochiensis TaxID=31243 RepID=A0A914HTW3_GLORO
MAWIFFVLFGVLIFFLLYQDDDDEKAEMVFQFSGFVDIGRLRSVIRDDILERVLSAEVPQSNCANPLFVAALNDHLNVVDILLEDEVGYVRETLIFLRFLCGVTSLWIATAAGHLEVVRRLLKVKGMDPNKGAKSTIDGKAIIGLSPLCIVTTNTICELLIEYGAEVDQQMSNGQTPLFCSCIRGNLEIVKCLFENGGSINAVDKLGRTPLMAAAFHGRAELVRYLLEKGARVDLVTNAGGRTAQDFADIGKRLCEAAVRPAFADIARMLREAVQRTAES